MSLCKKERYCFHCKGAHSPNSRECPFYVIEKEILEVAATEHLSIGAARRKVKPWNNKKSYASATKTRANPGIEKTNVDKTHTVSNEAKKATVTSDTSKGARPKNPVAPTSKNGKESKSSIPKHQLPASQLEIHEAPQDVPETPVSHSVESSHPTTEEASSVIGAGPEMLSHAHDRNDSSSVIPTEPTPKVQPLDESPSEVQAENPLVVTDMDSEISRTKRSRSSSPPVTRIASISTSNKFNILEREDELPPASPNTPKPSNKKEGTTKDAPSKKSKLSDRASKIKKPKIKSLFSKPLLSRSAHLAAGELSKKVHK